MRAKEYLESIENIQNSIDEDLKALERLQSRVNHITVRYEERTQGTNQKHDFSDELVKLLDLKDLIKKKIQERQDRVIECEKLLLQVEGSRSREILVKRYIEFKPITVVSGEIGVTYQHACRLHNQALNEFREVSKMD